jgi:predicted TIM-barrel fold metal-dependent hydrolase
MDACEIDVAVLLPINCERSHGSKMPSNDEVADLVKHNGNRLVGFASVDPNTEEGALSELRRAHDQLGLRGLKLNPALQVFDPTGAPALRIYEEAERLNMPIIIHTGLTFSNKFSIKHDQPLQYDDIARNHPKLRICLSHMGWPWLWDAITVTIRNPNVYLDTAGTFAGTPMETVHQISSTITTRVIENALGDRLMFGSDFPRIEENKMFDAISTLPVRKETMRKILGENAIVFLGEP